MSGLDRRTEKQKMLAGDLYRAVGDELAADNLRADLLTRAYNTTGKTVLFTGTSLTASIIYWCFFPMKFQAQMALLLVFLLRKAGFLPRHPSDRPGDRSGRNLPHPRPNLRRPGFPPQGR